MTKSCLVCDRPIRGRVDKKFCSSSCRIEFHNQNNRERNSIVRPINTILFQNRRILQALHSEGHVVASEGLLIRMGFRFGFFTSIEPGSEGRVQHCYEFAYRQQGISEYRISVLDTVVSGINVYE